MNRLCSLSCATIWSVAVAVAAQGQDVIKPMQGRDLRCSIKSTSPLGIQYELGGQPQEIGVLEIKSVEFAGEPNEFGKARTRIQAGQYDDGLTELQKVNPANLNDLQKAEFAYLQATCEANKALRDGTMPIRDAAKTVNQFLQNFPNSFHFFEMTDRFGWMAYHSGEFAAAQKSFQSLIDSKIPQMILMGHLGLARTALEQSAWDQAESHLASIGNIDANDDLSQDIKLIGRALTARVLAEKGQTPEAISQLEAIIKNESDERTRVFAVVYNSLGLCHLKSGDAKSALLAFLHTDQLYANEADPHAEALYYLGGLWAQLNETDRSNRAKQTLGQQYRNSLWAAKK